MSVITVLGASGFIGSHLVARLQELNAPCFAPDRDEDLAGKSLGHLIYCIGLTADFRHRSFETIDAHICALLKTIKECQFDSLLYVSSARLYCGRETIANEDDPVQVNPLHPGHLYNLSKAMGESLSLNCGKPAHVVRLSAVYGADFASENFLSAIIRDAILKKRVVLETSPDSERDYVSIADVVDLLVRISTGGRQRIYNVASGINVSHRELTRTVSEFTGCYVEIIDRAPKMSSPIINIDRIKKEFGFQPSRFLDDLGKLIDLFKTHYSDGSHKING